MKRCIECDDRRAARGSDYCRVCVWLVPRAALIAASAARIAKPRVLARVAGSDLQDGALLAGRAMERAMGVRQ